MPFVPSSPLRNLVLTPPSQIEVPLDSKTLIHLSNNTYKSYELLKTDRASSPGLDRVLASM